MSGRYLATLAAVALMSAPAVFAADSIDARDSNGSTPLLLAASRRLEPAFVEAWAAFRAASGPDFTSTLVALHSEQCLEAPPDRTNGAGLRQGVCAGIAAQRFAFTRGGDGFYAIRADATGFCVDVRDARVDDGVPLVQWQRCDRRHNQQFALRAVGVLRELEGRGR